jgi:hypothetical protein
VQILVTKKVAPKLCVYKAGQGHPSAAISNSSLPEVNPHFSISLKKLVRSFLYPMFYPPNTMPLYIFLLPLLALLLSFKQTSGQFESPLLNGHGSPPLGGFPSSIVHKIPFV